MNAKVLRGIVHGKTIELRDHLGMIDGEEVEVVVLRRPAVPYRPTGEGLIRTAGALADDTEWDGIMEEVHRERHPERRPDRHEP